MNQTLSPNTFPPSLPHGSVDSGGDDEFRIRGRHEIMAVVRELIERRLLVNLQFRPDNGFIITNLLALDADSGQLIFDAAQDVDANRAISAAGQLRFVALVDNIRTEFETTRVEALTFEQRPAFRTSMPGSILRLQRRNYFRVPAPLSLPLVCEVPLAGAESVRFEIGDLSVGGVAMLAGPDMDSFKPGAVFHNCRIELPEHGVITTSIELRNQLPMQDSDVDPSRLRFGCRFLNLAGTVQSLLQRYINHLERTRRGLS